MPISPKNNCRENTVNNKHVNSCDLIGMYIFLWSLIKTVKSAVEYKNTKKSLNDESNKKGLDHPKNKLNGKCRKPNQGHVQTPTISSDFGLCNLRKHYNKCSTQVVLVHLKIN